MGQKLENVRKKAENVKELGEQVKELGNKVVDDITSVRDILGEMPEDMDDDIMAAIEQVDDSSTQEATDNMNSEVKNVLEQGKNLNAETADEATEQQEKSQDASSKFSEINGNRFGKSGADASQRAADSAEAFGETRDQAQEYADQADDDFNSDLDAVMRH
jgi:hypothetical protein